MSATILALNTSCKSRRLAFCGLRSNRSCAIYKFMLKKPEKQRDEDCVALGRALRARRVQMGKEQADLGDAIGVSEGQISRFEAGINAMPYNRLTKAARYLDTTVSQLTKEAEGAPTDDDRLLLSIVREMPADEKKALMDFLGSQRKNAPKSSRGRRS